MLETSLVYGLDNANSPFEEEPFLGIVGNRTKVIIVFRNIIPIRVGSWKIS